MGEISTDKSHISPSMQNTELLTHEMIKSRLVCMPLFSLKIQAVLIN
jgi:hypothetical protein